MSYEVTANRRRPQLFSDLAGQEFVVSTLSSAIESKRIAHAYLFSGPRGVGKTSSARILAKSLNCKEGPTASPCGKCNNCREITTGSSMDVIEIDGASNTSVNDIREIKDEVLFAPSGSRYKIYIIDEVHMLSNSAFNALLKTIEEPPEYIVFIFATTEIHKVPATIRSRCQQFNFRLIPTEILKDLIVEACTDMKIKYTDDAVYWIAKEGNGSSRDAYTLFDQVASFSNNDITLEKIREKLGLVGLDNLNELAEYMADSNSNAVLNKCDYILSTGVSVEQFIVDLAEYFRNLLFLSYGITKESLLGCSSERFSQIAIDSFSIIQLEHGVDLILKLYKDIRYSVNPRFELELLLSRLSALTDYISNTEILEKIKTIKESITGGTFSSESKTFTENSDVEKKKNFNTSQVSQKEDIKENPASQFFNQFKSGHKKSEVVKNIPEKVELTRKDEVIEKNNEVFIISPNSNISIETLKKNLIRKVKTISITLAATLEKAEKWEKINNKIYLTYSNSFESALIEKEKNKILGYIKEFDTNIIELALKKTEDIIVNDTKQENDEQLEKILTMFRGSII